MLVGLDHYISQADSTTEGISLLISFLVSRVKTTAQTFMRCQLSCYAMR